MKTVGPLSNYRVIDLTNEWGILATRIMAGLGAEVIRIEPPGGDPLRMTPPVVPCADGEELGLFWVHMTGGKSSVVLDLSEPAGIDALWALLDSADVLFESGPRHMSQQAGVTWERLHERCPELVHTTITPFGLNGPRAHWKGGDLIALAAGGLMSLCGDPDRAPLRPSVEQGCAQASLQAMVGTLIALQARKMGASGQQVDVSMQEAIANTLGNAQQTYFMDRVVFRRAGGGRATGEAGTRLVWPCGDGYIAWGRNPASMPLLHQWMLDEGFEPDFDPAAWSLRAVVGAEAPPQEEVQRLEARIEEFFSGYSKMYLYEEGQRRGAMVCPVSTVADLLDNAQLVERGFFHSVYEPSLGRLVTQPGAPFKMSESSWTFGASPRLGEQQGAFAPTEGERTVASWRRPS